MSGAELLAVVGGISAILGIANSISDIYSAVKDLHGLPKAFSIVASRLSIVREILDSANRRVEAEEDQALCKAIKPIVERCRENINALEDIFESVKPGEDVKKVQRYYKAVKAKGKGGKVESLMTDVIRDVHLLSSQRGTNTATADQQKEILVAIQALAVVPPSVPDNEFHDPGFSMNQSGQGNSQQYTANGDVYSLGGGKQYNARNQTFVYENRENLEISCKRALFLTDPRDDRDKLVNLKGSRVNGTCEWIIVNPFYTSWFCSPSELLWLSGGPGMGKSMIAIFLAQELELMAKDSQYTSFLQYFCDNKDEKRNTSVTVLRGLILQILQLQPTLIHHILPSFEEQNESLFSNSSFESLWRIFQTMICDPLLGNIYCVLDGIDECDEVSLEVLLKKFAALLSAQSDRRSQLKLIVLSRDLPDFIPLILSSFPRIRLDPDAKTEVNGDIDKFIDAKVKELSVNREYPEPLIAHVKEVFQSRAQGTFLWIGIVAKVLEKCKATEVKRFLENFPRGLDGVYARILLQIDSDRRDMAAQILRWVVMAFRPLTLLELSIAFEASVKPSPPFSCVQIMSDMVSYCGYLLEIKGDEVNLIHQSAKDYLLRKTPDRNPELEVFRIKEETANREIARKCFYYLQSGALAAGPVDLNSNKTRLKEFPLLSYSVLYWPDHSKTLARTEDIFDISLPFYKEKSGIRESWLMTYSSNKGYGFHPPLSSPLQIASYLGILPLTQNLLQTNGFIERAKRSKELKKVDVTGKTALIWAAWNGHEAVVQLLLEKGANVEAKDNDGWTALIRAAWEGHEAVVQLLLEKGANAETKDNYERTALIYAAWNGHEAVVQLLLEKGANVEAKKNDRRTALICAAARGHEAVVQLLLEKGANFEAKNYEGWTPLIWAAWGGHQAVVQLLLEKGANVEAKDDDGLTALSRAASGWHEAVVQLLLEKGANVEANDNNGWTALIRAAWEGHEAVVQLLLEKGANAETKDNYERTALIYATWNGHEAVVQLLLEKGANVEAKKNDRRTALICAAARGHEAVVQLLLDKGAIIEAKYNDGWTALISAAARGHEAVVQLLLEKGADIDAMDNDGRTAHYWAAEGKHKGIMRLLTTIKKQHK
ncbi:MAG: hypothetical protein M1829_003860 [Trizodia sp. TS-e1964]|nr:MAG: hypothetical protein M1829_003860 [Trizodia sp. TS-e1964]